MSVRAARRVASGGKSGYHHGDLRTAALEEGLRRLEHVSVEQLSLRDIARQVGVSAPALYRHFPDKDALMGAIATRGFEMLADAQRQAMEGREAAEAFIASGRAYVRFAIAKPSLFRMIFSCAVKQTHPFETPPEDSAAALLVRTIASLLDPEAPEADRMVAAMRAWSMVHGLAMLILDAQVPLKDIDTMIERVIDVDTVTLLPSVNPKKLKPRRKAPPAARSSSRRVAPRP